MNVMSYNCLGLGNGQVVNQLANIVSRKAPKVLFLMETKSLKDRMEFVRRKLGYYGCFTIVSVGRSGGMCVLWEEGVELSVQ